MTGWRGGIMAAPKWIAQACDKMQGQSTLLRFAHERYTQSRLYAGDRLSIVLDSYIDKGSVEQAAPRADSDTP